MDFYRSALILAAALSVLAVIRLSALGVWRQLPFLITFLVFNSIQWFSILIFHANSPIYAHIYVATEPLNWVFAIFMVREMYRTVFRLFPAISEIGKWAGHLAAIGAVIGVALMFYETPGRLTGTVVQGYTVVWEMGVFSVLALFIAFMIFILCRYPVRLNSNLLKNVAIFSVYFFLTAATLELFPSETDHSSGIRNLILTLIQALCYACWGFMLRRPDDAPMTGNRWRHVDSSQMLRQLSNINNMLDRTVRR